LFLDDLFAENPMLSGNENLLIHVARRLMACEFEVRFSADRYPHGTDVALQALDQVEALEEQISYFRPTSEITRINLLAADGPLEVAPPLFDLLRSAMTLYEETSGAYDITSTPLWEVWGFARRAGQIPTDAQLAEARSTVGGHLVELDPAQRTIHFKKPGVKINLGSIGKGYALDVCAEQLSASGMNDFLLHGGQSSVLAWGKPAQPWEIGIRHPLQPNRRLGVVRLENQALGTSGGQFQSFRHQGRRYGHILDPRLGYPAENVLLATVVAPTAALADALSTAFYVLGPKASLDYCQKHPGFGVLLICPDATSNAEGGIKIHTAGLIELPQKSLEGGKIFLAESPKQPLATQ
jgi:thiamine biosynthesis lipoprotein